MTTSGQFLLWTNEQKAETCQLATHVWDDLKAAADVDGGSRADPCGIITTHIYQSYSWFVQDLSEGIIGALTQKMTENLEKGSKEFQQ